MFLGRLVVGFVKIISLLVGHVVPFWLRFESASCVHPAYFLLLQGSTLSPVCSKSSSSKLLTFSAFTTILLLVFLSHSLS